MALLIIYNLGWDFADPSLLTAWTFLIGPSSLRDQTDNVRISMAQRKSN